jgi:hypothetical protein
MSPSGARILPFPGSHEAPWFDGSKPHKLPRLIRQVEELFRLCGVDDEQEQKETALRYVSIEVEEQWMALPKYDSGSWTKFKDEIITLYPEMEARYQGTLRRVLELVHKHQGLSFDVGLRVPQFVRAFQAEASKLMGVLSILSNFEAVK